jgi:hypothetical protein
VSGKRPRVSVCRRTPDGFGLQGFFTVRRIVLQHGIAILGW